MQDMPLSKMASYQALVHRLDPRIRPLTCSKSLLEGANFNILTFTSQFDKANGHMGQTMMPRIIVEFFWIGEIWRRYPADDSSPHKHRLIGQAYSPKYEVYWLKRLDPDALRVKRARQSRADLWSYPRNLTPEELQDKGVVLLGNHEWEYILPEVQLMPIYHVSFLELARKVKVANPGKPLGLELMRRLWRLLIREVYDFVEEMEKMTKLEEARAVTENVFEEAMKSASKTPSKKRELSSESESEAKASKIPRRQSDGEETGDFATTGRSDSRTSKQTKAFSSVTKHADSPEAKTSDSKSSSTESTSSARKDVHQALQDSPPPVQEPEQTSHTADLQVRLTSAERQIVSLKCEKDEMDHKYRSQRGQLLASERDAREFRKANPSVARYNKAKNEAIHNMKRSHHELNKAYEKVAGLERELAAEKRKTARLEAWLVTAGIRVQGQKAMEMEADLSHGQRHALGGEM